jgi:tight adherence protein C
MTAFLALLVGTAAMALFVYALWMLLAQARSHDDQTYRDEPPKRFKVLWPLVLAVATLSTLLLRESRARKIDTRLQKGGVDYSLTPQQFFSAQVVYAALGATLFLMVGGSLSFSTLGCLLLGAGAGFLYPELWLTEKIKCRQLTLLKALPFFLDVVTLGVESGLNLAGAIHQAVEKTRPGPLTYEMNRVMRDVRAGRARVDALRDLAARLNTPPISSLVSAMVQGELTGSSLGPILRAQSDQRRTERFQRAEKMAMEAPVKMLAPLVMFIFPCTFVVIGFPIVMKFLSSGL